MIEGEVGIGKTALMRQIYNIDYGPNVLKLVSHCYSVESTFSMKSWRDLFVQLDNLCSKGELHLSEASMHFSLFYSPGMLRRRLPPALTAVPP